MVLADNQSTLWLNPNAETDPGATSTDEAAPKTVAAIAFRQSLASGAGMGELAVDDLVVATEFAELLSDAGPPAIIRDLADKTVAAGQSVTLEVQASGTPPLSYQWFCNGWELPGADGPVLSLGPARDEHVGAYHVIVSNAAGSVTSAEVWLTVEPAQFLVSIRSDTVTGVQLEWVADPEQTYSVWNATSPDGEYSMLCEGLQFADGQGLFEDGPVQGAMRFYRLGAP
jgi:Immunoglobulin domain